MQLVNWFLLDPIRIFSIIARKIVPIVETDEQKDSVKVEEKQSIDVLGIGLDTSGSMAGILSTVVNEGMGVVDALNPEQVVFCEFSSHFECYTLDKEKSKEIELTQ